MMLVYIPSNGMGLHGERGVIRGSAQEEESHRGGSGYMSKTASPLRIPDTDRHYVPPYLPQY
jgi:hypothetical protein